MKNVALLHAGEVLAGRGDPLVYFGHGLVLSALGDGI
jgi:hypothetical protein